MHCAVLQDWITVRDSSASGIVSQSSTDWLQTGEFENAQFFIDVRYCSAPRLYLIFETAPAPFEKFWKPLQYEGALDLVPLVGTTTIVQTAFAHATYGPPLASYLRWTLNGTAGAWEVCFRITMSAS